MSHGKRMLNAEGKRAQRFSVGGTRYSEDRSDQRDHRTFINPNNNPASAAGEPSQASRPELSALQGSRSEHARRKRSRSAVTTTNRSPQEPAGRKLSNKQSPSTQGDVEHVGRSPTSSPADLTASSGIRRRASFKQVARPPQPRELSKPHELRRRDAPLPVTAAITRSPAVASAGEPPAQPERPRLLPAGSPTFSSPSFSSPPLRAAVSPRAASQHLSRVESTASLSRGPHNSAQTTPLPRSLSARSIHEEMQPLPLPPSAFAMRQHSSDPAAPPTASAAVQDKPVAAPPDALPQDGVVGSSSSESGASSRAARSPSSTRSRSSEAPTAPASSCSPGEEDEDEDEGLLVQDCSGFRNRGNDCYACSVLSMLLRSVCFRTALLTSPLIRAVDAYLRDDAVQPHPAVDASSGYVLTSAQPAGRSSGVGRASSPGHSEESCSGSSVGSSLVSVSEDGGVVPCVHTVLADFVTAEQRRERFTALVSSRSILPERRRALVARFMAAFTRAKTGANTYALGIDLKPLAALFDGEFFVGEQEDAHELFVALVAKLESEAMEFDKRRRARLASSAQSEETSPSRSTEAPTAREAPADEPHHSSGEPREGEVCPASVTATPPPSPPRPVWINELMQGNLLNIIRCRNPKCMHEIATEEPFINLSVTIANAAGGGADSDDCDGSSPAERPGHKRKAEATSAAREPPELADLLQRSMQYEPLEGYICDACRSSDYQYQGGCFYGSPPPLLTVQLKRFAVRFDAAGGLPSIAKDHTKVRVNESLEIISLAADTATGARAPSSSAAPTSADSRRPPCFISEEKRLGDAVRQAEQAAAHHAREAANSKLQKEADAFFLSEEDDGDDVHAPAAAPAATDTPLEAGPDEVCVDALRSVYRLQGTVLHLGNTLHFGHYVAEFRVPSTPAAAEEAGGDREEVWKLANDALVKTEPSAWVKERRRHCSESYLLLYEKVSEESMRCPVWRVLPPPRQS